MFQAENLDRLIADELQAHFACATIGRRIVVLEQTGSTNDAILQVANANATEGLVLFAEQQTAGRGQRGNKWESAAGKGLCFSVLLQPGLAVDNSQRLTEWAAKTIAGTIENHCRIEAAIKPPNDVYVRGRKVAGVLVEMRAMPGAPHVAILGIGLNVNQMPSDFSEELRDRATSLAIIRHGLIDRHQLAVELLQNLDRTYRDFFVR